MWFCSLRFPALAISARAIDAGDRKGAWHCTQFGLQDADKEVSAPNAGPPRRVLARRDQRAFDSDLGRRPQRQRAVQLGGLRLLLVEGFHAGKRQRAAPLLMQGGQRAACRSGPTRSAAGTRRSSRFVASVRSMCSASTNFAASCLASTTNWRTTTRAVSRGTNSGASRSTGEKPKHRASADRCGPSAAAASASCGPPGA